MVRPFFSFPCRNRPIDRPHAEHFSVHPRPSRRTPYNSLCGAGIPELVATISSAGGHGILTTLTQPNQDALRKVTRKTRRVTDKSFDVNMLLPSINPPDYGKYARAAGDGARVFEIGGKIVSFSLLQVSLRSFGVLMGGLAGPSSSSRRVEVLWSRSECVSLYICADGGAYMFVNPTLLQPGTTIRPSTGPSGTNPQVYFTQFSLARE
jgi:hypothetical protein